MNDVIGSVDDKEKAIEWFDRQVNNSAGKDCPSVSYQVFDCEERQIYAEWTSDN